MAGAGYKLFVSGDVLTAAQVNTYLNEQTVMVFATSAARTSALSAVLAEGMMSYLQDSNTVFYYDGAAWNALASGDITAITAGNGISVTSGTGPVPTVAIDTATTVDKTTAQTLTNKTLTSPALTTPTISTLTTNGDLLYGTGSGALSRLGIGSSAQVLTVASGVPSWATPAASASGLTLISSTSFTTSSGHSVNSCFSAAYDNYRIMLKLSAATGSGTEMLVRLRASGTDATTNYTTMRQLSYSAGVSTDLNPTGTDDWTMGVISSTSPTGLHTASMDIFDPFAATPTQGTSILNGYYGGSYYLLICSDTNTNSTSYDGFTLIPLLGTITGTVRVYGYQNS